MSRGDARSRGGRMGRWRISNVSVIMAAPRFYRNPAAQPTVDRTLASADARPFHRLFATYRTTPLHDLPKLAASLGLGRLLAKDESARMGLPAYKFLGASWAIYRTLLQRLPLNAAAIDSLDALRAQIAPHRRNITLVAATDGNHGRAVAHVARQLGLAAHIFVPRNMTPARRDAIRSEGAALTVVDGSYDDAVAHTAELDGTPDEAPDEALGSHTRWTISDTAWTGYTQIPAWIIEGYATIFQEVDEQLAARGQPQPDLVVVPIGVGALATAVVSHYRGPKRDLECDNVTRIVGVEPLTADCMKRAVQAGKPVHVPGPHDSALSGLNCGLASPLALPFAQQGIDLFVALDDEAVYSAMRDLAGAGVVAGECGAAGLAALRLALADAGQRDFLNAGPETSALVLITEADTDPENYERVVGLPEER